MTGQAGQKNDLSGTGKATAKKIMTGLGLPDLPYFPGAPVFQPLSPISRTCRSRNFPYL